LKTQKKKLFEVKKKIKKNHFFLKALLKRENKWGLKKPKSHHRFIQKNHPCLQHTPMLAKSLKNSMVTDVRSSSSISLLPQQPWPLLHCCRCDDTISIKTSKI
jgi:hypothetical protein